MPRAVGKEVERHHTSLYRGIQAAYPGAERTRVKASVLLISGCMDNQFSQDGLKNGAFTGALKKVWNGGRFSGSYRRFRDKVRSILPPTQSPNYYTVGASSPWFERQKPFTI